MLTYDDALNLNYYKKTTFTGWPGPYIFDLTDDSKKTDNTFPFTDDGKKQCVDWINEVISAHSNEYPKNKTDGENL